MPAWGWILVAIGIVIVIAAVVWGVWSKRRRDHLRSRFGPEYDRSVDAAGDRRAAEADLADRERRRDALDVRPLSPTARDRYSEAWRVLQSRFVDSPAVAVREADALVTQAMGDMGYPMSNFDERDDVVSVDHPTVVENYRSAHDVSVANDRGQATTEDLRSAMVHYRALFEELLAYAADGRVAPGSGTSERRVEEAS
jgi:hypothetical protein